MSEPQQLWLEILGYVGGLIIAFCTIPQTYKMWKSKSAKDLSLAYAISYSIGLALTSFYLVAVRAWAAAIPCLFEFFQSGVLVGLKLYLDRYHTKTDSEVNLNEQPSQSDIFG